MSTPPTVKKYRFPMADEQSSVAAQMLTKSNLPRGCLPDEESHSRDAAYDQGLSRLEAKTQLAIIEKQLPDNGSKGAPLDRLSGQLHALRLARASPSVPQVAARARKTATETLSTLSQHLGRGMQTRDRSPAASKQILGMISSLQSQLGR